MFNKFTVPTYAWYGDKPLTIVFPTNWDVTECRMEGHSTPLLADRQIREKLGNPIGIEPLHELAKGKKECVLIVDDLTRPTKASQVLPAILDEIHEGGISDEHIRFVIATGAHGPMRLDELVKKLGIEIPDRSYVFNHNVYENNMFLGKTSRGTPVFVNKEVMACDLKVTIGCIIPHGLYGFGGGSKTIVPGVASIDTIAYHHEHFSCAGIGRIEGNTARLDSEEIARMIGADFIVNVIINAQRDCCNLFCGDIIAAFREGVKFARGHYVTKLVREANVVVANGYPMENLARKSLIIANESAKPNGDVVIPIHTPEGARSHYHSGRFGMNYGGRGWRPEIPKARLKTEWKADRTIVVAPHHSLKDEVYYGTGSIWVKSWTEALELLYDRHDRRSKIKVAIYPYSTIQISEEDVALN